jgi:hypothetical protein
MYYGDQVYWLRNERGMFIPASTEVIKRRLKERGFSGESTKSLNSEIDSIMNRLLDDNVVEYVGPLAGYDPGAHDVAGTRILVTKGPKIIQPNPDYKNSMVYDYVERLLDEDEAILFHTWVKLAREALITKSLRRGQAMVLTGEPDCGKSFLAKSVAAMLGGRVANPAQFLQGKTSFNAHMFAAEFLLIDDAGGHDDFQSRKAMGDGIKQLIAEAYPQCHGKGQTALTLLPFWRLMITVNDEEEPLQILPNMGGGVGDKMIVLRAVARAIPVDTTKGGNYTKFEADFLAAIPDYLGWLEEFDPPTEVLDQRFGMVPYINKGIDHILHQFTPEQKLMFMVVEEVQTDKEQELTARDIEKVLKAPGVSSVEHEARNLLRGPGSCGKYLTRVAKNYPHILTQAGRVPGGGPTLYRIAARKAEKKA